MRGFSFLQPDGEIPPMSYMEIQDYKWMSNLLGIITTVCGVLTIMLICRYTTQSMMTYKFHLLNMTINILLCDLMLSIFAVPHTIFPATGVCLVGPFNQWALKQFGKEKAFFLHAVIVLYFVISSLAAVTNATLHRYMSITKLIEPLPSYLTPRTFKLLAFCIQVVIPVITLTLICFTNLNTEEAVEFNSKEHPDIYQRTLQYSCVLVPSDFIPLVLQILFFVPLAGYGCLCVGFSFYLLFHCWTKLMELRNFKSVSKKTIEMQHQLALSITIQTIAPNFLVGGCVIFLIVGFVIKIEFIEKFVTTLSGVLAFHIGSLHSVLNFLILWLSIPAYRHGFYKDVRLCLRLLIFPHLRRHSQAHTLVKTVEKKSLPHH